jgi:hypothetical protein
MYFLGPGIRSQVGLPYTHDTRMSYRLENVDQLIFQGKQMIYLIVQMTAEKVEGTQGYFLKAWSRELAVC